MTQSYTEKLHFSFVLHQLTSKMFYGYEKIRNFGKNYIV